MRAVTLSDNRVLNLLRRKFVCGWRNIKGKTSYAGSSNTHLPSYEAVTVSNCSGHHNVQMFFMTSDGRVVHCLPGYWNPEAFLDEAYFAIALDKLYRSSSLSIARRNERFLDLHLEHAFRHDTRLQRQSKLQGFDAQNIERRRQSDFKREEGFVTSGLKSADQIIHERMAERPFVAYEFFDTAAFIDMGRKKYKYDKGMPEHKSGRMRK